MKAAEEMKREKKNVQWSGYGELGNISQKPLQPTAEITTDRFRDILNDVQRYIETNGGATESEMKAIWNSLSCAITESERRQPTAEGAEEILDKHSRYHPVTNLVYSEDVLSAMNEFATLHAQKIADKMVEERLRELAWHWSSNSYLKCSLGDFDIARGKFNNDFNEYLKSREK